MKAKIIFAAALSALCVCSAGVKAQWQPVGDKIKTDWAAKVDPQKTWQEYPRPQMQRAAWLNLNGLWDYAVVAKDSQAPSTFDGKILVPFPIESSLSGVGKRIYAKDELWYRCKFTVPKAWKKQNVRINFGAVDWKAEVFVNGKSVGSHTGGYAPFSFDITPALVKGENEIKVKVFDPTNEGYQPVGKQNKNPEGIFYTPSSGIWQTVWIEPVNKKHIEDLAIVPDVDKGILNVKANVSGAEAGDIVEVVVKDGSAVVADSKVAQGSNAEISIPNAKLWSPDSPNLYNLEVKLLAKGKKSVDAFASYAAMRKISVGTDKDGYKRMFLNNKPLFQMGPLDQGYWPDGLYTAPSYDAMKFDLDKTKAWGFNMIRKHMKVEPDLWFYYCDKTGIVVWQDMPAGSINHEGADWDMTHFYTKAEWNRDAASEADYRAEWKDIIDSYKNHPCIIVWTPFNESWGQFKTAEISQYTKQLDPTRLVNSASGGNHFMGVGDILDLHKYPSPEMYITDPARVEVMGEFGGLGLPLKGHVWQDNNNWGYVQFKGSKEVTDKYVEIADGLMELVKKGAAAGVYTQTTDVEIECNGLMTYDRKVIKIEEDRVAAANKALCHSLDGK